MNGERGIQQPIRSGSAANLEPRLVAGDRYLYAGQRFTSALPENLLTPYPFRWKVSKQDLINRLCGKKLEQLGGREVRDFRYQKVDMVVQLHLQVAWASQIPRKYNFEFGMVDAKAIRLESIGN